jgi:hypothetical protein
MQSNRTEQVEISPHDYTSQIFDKTAIIYFGENTASLTSDAGRAGYPHVAGRM